VDFRISGIPDAQKLKSFFILLPTENFGIRGSTMYDFGTFVFYKGIVMLGVLHGGYLAKQLNRDVARYNQNPEVEVLGCTIWLQGESRCS